MAKLKILIALILVPFCATSMSTARAAAQAARHSGHANPPASNRKWVDTRLYFGLGPADAPDQGVSEAVWRAFLDREVTPRFPAGLSVADVYGQWLSQAAKGAMAHPERIRSKLLIIDYPATEENARRIEAIRAAWKRQTGDESVLKITQPVAVSF